MCIVNRASYQRYPFGHASLKGYIYVVNNPLHENQTIYCIYIYLFSYGKSGDVAEGFVFFGAENNMGSHVARWASRGSRCGKELWLRLGSKDCSSSPQGLQRFFPSSFVVRKMLKP